MAICPYSHQLEHECAHCNPVTPAEYARLLAEVKALREAIEQQPASAPVGAGQEPIPDRVYWAPLADNFYSAEGQGMGLEFYRKWKPRRAEVPQGESFGWGPGSAHNPFKDPPRAPLAALPTAPEGEPAAGVKEDGRG